MSKETIEEEAGRFSKLRKEALKEKKEWPPDCIYHESFNGFMCGAECQAERMYSEEEVLRIIQDLKSYLGVGDEVAEKDWFNQFKKQKS